MTTMNDDVNLKITRVDTSDVNPGENGAPDTVKVIESSPFLVETLDGS